MIHENFECTVNTSHKEEIKDSKLYKKEMRFLLVLRIFIIMLLFINET